ncbi:hypothetical protein BD310DRAFT_925137 [Dichomitus squalens]|uniref:Uncharacterized protein n=1 Tax=Dichomitus squalens TaxID=114155 RepID=A0A4V2K8C2_9APHY|nr:hypothetical protein BD310DRAFT_925137 [Dichomitus squalens]
MTGRRGFHVHRAGSYEGVPVCLSAGLCGSLSSAYKCVNVNGGRRPRLGGLETEDRRSTGVAQTLSCTCPRIIWRQVGRRLGAYGVGWRDRLLPIRSSPLQYANVVRN